MELKELTKEQEQKIRSAYLEPANKISVIIDRIKAAGIPVETATTWLFVHHYIGYDDKTILDRLA